MNKDEIHTFIDQWFWVACNVNFEHEVRDGARKMIIKLNRIWVKI